MAVEQITTMRQVAAPAAVAAEDLLERQETRLVLHHLKEMTAVMQKLVLATMPVAVAVVLVKQVRMLLQQVTSVVRAETASNHQLPEQQFTMLVAAALAVVAAITMDIFRVVLVAVAMEEMEHLHRQMDYREQMG